MGATPVCQITAAGCIRPTFADCLAYVQASYRAIYGADMILDAASQDGQFMALLAAGIHDANGETLAAYNAFSPSTAQGAGLSSNVKINGIRRKSATFSTCDFLNVGQAGITVPGGVITDPVGNQWSLPDFTIPDAGQITVTGTCVTLGAIALAPGAIDTANGKGSIATITRGWQSVTNLSAAAPGQPVESDSALRQRQSVSTAIPSQSLLEGLYGTLLAVTGAIRCRMYENDTDYTDANGLPGHSICAVIDGGDAQVIADIIRRKKGNAGTYGTTVMQSTDAAGIVRNIAFSRSVEVPISYALQVRKLASYTAKTDLDVRTALSDWTNALGIGNSVYRDQAYVPAKLNGTVEGMGYEIISLAIARNGNVPLQADVPLAYDERATCAPDSVTTSIVP
ncbi:baseplate J/gp47 family protein [Methylobacterium fujisawaense]|uniref:baseplate J/gp47 family protein n=1 Tax=Methylobacterium fujisawaense TaxID=107400 RepID=UPI0031F596D6